MKYNDNGEYKDIYVKSLDTLPVGTEVDFDGNEVPSGWTEVEDVVTGNGWTMIKYDNGVMIGYTLQRFGVTINNAWGSLYTSPNISFNAYPVEFTSVPVANILQTENSSCFIMNWDSSVNTKSQLGGFRAVRPDTSSQTRNFGLSAIVIGRWK